MPGRVKCSPPSLEALESQEDELDQGKPSAKAALLGCQDLEIASSGFLRVEVVSSPQYHPHLQWRS